MVGNESVKTAKIKRLENLALYGRYCSPAMVELISVAILKKHNVPICSSSFLPATQLDQSNSTVIFA